MDSILESGYIEELIQDKTLTPFPTVYNTERPDVVASELLEGKIAIIVDGTPFVLIVPALLSLSCMLRRITTSARISVPSCACCAT